MILVLGKSALSVPDTRFSRVSGSTLVTDFEAGKRECEEIEQMFFLIIYILFTTPYNQNIHNEGQRHIIVHTDLTIEM